MGDIGDTFNAQREESKEKRGQNRSNSAEILKQRNIKFDSKNAGIHLVVTGKNCLIDFWPGTGKFITRNGSKGRGVFNLIKLCN